VFKLKILLTVHQFFPEYASGTEVLTYSVAKELRARGHEVFVFTGFPAATQLKDSDRFDEYDLDGIKVFRFHHAVVPMGGQRLVTELEYCNLLAASYFKRLISELNPSIIHFFHVSRLGAALMDVAFKARIPSYYTPTDFWSVCPTSQLLLSDGKMCAGPTKSGGNCVKHVIELTRSNDIKKVARLVPEKVADGLAWMAARGALPSRQAINEVGALSRRKDFIVKRLNGLDKIIAPTQLTFDVLASNGVNRTQLVKSAYGIDTSYYDDFQRTERADGVLTVGFIGTISSHKGCHVLLKAMALTKGDQKLRLKVYGRTSDFPDYFAELRELAGDDPRIEFCGTFPNSEIGTVLSNIDVLVVPSLWYENTPLVIYSALASGCPVIASNFAGMAEAVQDNVNGRLFTPGDEKHLSGMLRDLSRDPAALKALQKNCKKPKSIVQYTDELLALYSEEKKVPAAATDDQDTWLDIPAFEPAQKTGEVSGWALIQGSAPVSIHLVVDNVSISEVKEFTNRADVQDGFKKQGVQVKSALLGFILNVPVGVDRSKAAIELVAKSGARTRVEFNEMVPGSAQSLENNAFLGLDSENWL